MIQTKEFLLLGGLLKTDYKAKITEIEGKIPTILYKIFETNSSFHVK